MTRRIQWLAFIAAAIILAIIFMLSRQMMADYANRPIIKREVPVIRPDVSVVNVKADRYQASISAFGAANPRFNVLLSAQVAGQAKEGLGEGGVGSGPILFVYINAGRQSPVEP